MSSHTHTINFESRSSTWISKNHSVTTVKIKRKKIIICIGCPCYNISISVNDVKISQSKDLCYFHAIIPNVKKVNGIIKVVLSYNYIGIKEAKEKLAEINEQRHKKILS